MAELSVSGLNKFFGERHLLKDLSFEIFKGDRIGLIGPNGCGKTTLFRILSGECDYECGVVSFGSGMRVGILQQLPDYPPELTVRDVLWQAFDHLKEMEEEMRLLESRMASGDKKTMARYSYLQTAFEDAGGYDPELPYTILTNGLKISKEMQERSFMSLSGGERTRISLARIMLTGADILLLDEPTNHLDIESIEWLEGYLKTFKGAVLIVSHDRYFLDRTTNRTLEMEDGHIISWPGNYSYYADKKAELMEQLEAAKRRQDKEIERLSFTVERMKGWGLGNKKVMKRAFAMEKRLNRIERIKEIKKQRPMKGRFTEAARSGDEVYYIENLSSGYDHPLVEDFNALVLRGERIALLGPNGCGKSTLLNTILGIHPPLSGLIYTGVGVKTGLLPQTVTFDMPERTLFETMLYTPGCTPQAARDRLAAYEFKGEEVFKKVSTLSGGEKTRLRLCLFMNEQVNTLFLDEPTNHLDIMTREWIEEAIDDFSETMLFVSHDRYFINRFATRIWYIEDGHIIDYPGDYEQFRAMRERAQQQPKQLYVAKDPKPEPEAQKQKPKNSKQAEKQRRELERKAAQIESRISDIEEQMAGCADDYIKLGELLEEKQALEDNLLEIYEALE